MNNLFTYLKGDKALWAIVILISLLSFLPVYSASSNLQYVIGSGTTYSHLGKHAAIILTGFVIMIFLQRINYLYLGGFAVLLMPLILLALLITMLQGHTISGANASRWLQIPGVPITIQTSSFAALFLMIFIARYLTKNQHNTIDMQKGLLFLFYPILPVVSLIFPANGSTALMIFGFAILLLFLGNFPLKYLIGLIVIGILGAAFFVFIALNFADKFESHRVDTWKNRIEGFMGNKGPEMYQVAQAKTAIVEGGILGVGSGKSALKQTLPQSSSDFIFAIIVEEYGLWGAVFLIIIFLLMLYRIIFIATRIHTTFGRLLVLGLGIPIVGQALINMAVAVNLIPVTGQPLPLISYGGTSMWVSYIALGIILNVSKGMKTKEEMKQEENKKSKIIEDIA